MSFSENLLQMSLFLKAVYKFSLTFLQIVSSLSTNLLKTLSETVYFASFLDRFRPSNKQNPKKFYKFSHEFLQISAWFSTNFSMVFRIFYKLQFATKFFYKFHFFCLQMWFSENPCLQILHILSTNFSAILEGGGNLPLSLWYTNRNKDNTTYFL